MDWGRLGLGALTGGLSEAYYAGTGQKGYGAPARGEGQYAGVGQIGMGPFAQGQQINAMDFANTRGGGPFRGQQEELGNMLMGQARGENSFAAERLRQDMGRLQAQQQSMAAGARPSNAAMASRLAMQNSGQLGASMAGQSQLAQIAERNAAAQAAGGVLGQARGQDTEAYLGGQNLALQNMLGQQQGQIAYENQRTQRAGAMMGAPTRGEQLLGLGQGALSAFAAMSDVRLKKNVRPLDRVVDIGESAAPGLTGGRRAIDILQKQMGPVLGRSSELTPEKRGLVPLRPAVEKFLSVGAKPYEFEYKTGRGLPQGKRTGVMAQNVEGVAPDAVIDTPEGKMVDFGKLGPALMASQGYLNRKLEAMKAALRGRDRGAMPEDLGGIASQVRSIPGGGGAMDDYYQRKIYDRIGRGAYGASR